MSDWLPWLLLIIVLIILALAIWWWWKKRKTVVSAPPTPTRTAAPAAAPAPPPPAPSVPDDLTVIEGIGPKIASIFNNAGIKTFAQLAQADVQRLQEILKTAGLQFADPTTWPQQAKLAAEGKIEELKALQESLKGGRRA